MFLSRDPSKKPFPISDQIWKKDREKSTITHHRLRLLWLFYSSLFRKMKTPNKMKTCCEYGTGLLFRTPRPIPDITSMTAEIELKWNNCNYNCRGKGMGILNGRWNCFFPTLPPTDLTSPDVDTAWDLLRFSFLHNVTEPSEDLWKGEVPLAFPVEFNWLRYQTPLKCHWIEVPDPHRSFRNTLD